MSFHALCEALETLLLQHEQMSAYAERKKESLVANDIDVLNEMVTKEARLIKLIAEAEGRRQQAVNAILREAGFTPTPSTTVASLIRMITNAEDKLKLSELADKLSAAVERVRALNELNMKLTRQSIEFNDFSLNLLASAYDDQDYVYKKPTESAYGQSKLSFFDSKA
ncbi:FlgN protein [Cohnella sp. SGD-V74]|uniref:flagellar protein FlgN n=1 Tax=unclassified Cohnella TaxID=2636738 RepID=UPI000D47CA3D|nr:MULTISPECIES: flagellar protein FlgN [unclassified Cohnella]PRX67102.1 FlgN protein [Cohnella sp. SGD-V74]